MPAVKSKYKYPYLWFPQRLAANTLSFFSSFLTPLQPFHLLIWTISETIFFINAERYQSGGAIGSSTFIIMWDVLRRSGSLSRANLQN